MEATIINCNVNVITTVNAVVVKETTYQKLKRLSKKYNLQTNDPKFARVGLMRYMLDTCAFIDAVTEPDNLGADVCALMEDYENEFCISIETIREVILLQEAFENEECLLELEMRNEKLGIERELKEINRELKEIGPQADEVGEQQLTAIGQQLSKKYYAPWMICEPNEKEGQILVDDEGLMLIDYGGT